MPLPLDPPLTPGDVSGLTDLQGSQLAPWFDSGQVKALIDLMNRYTADVLIPYVDDKTGGA